MLPVLQRVRIVKLLTQHVVRGDFWVPTNGSRLVGGEATSRQFASTTGSKWAACHFSSGLIQLGCWRKPGLLFAPYLHPKEEEE